MIDLSNINWTELETKESSSGSRNGGITFVYNKNGKRIVFSKRVLELLGNPKKVSFRLTDDYLIILGGSNGDFTLHDDKTNVIYNAPLIREILNHYRIEYDECFCQTFSETEEVSGMENAIAVKMLRGQTGGDAE